MGNTDNMNWTALSVVAILTIIVLGGVVYIKSKIQRFSRSIFGTDSLIDGYEKQKRELSESPKSVSSMTRIYLPLILKDFPEFNLEEFKQKADNMLISALIAITNKNPSQIKNASKDLKEQVSLEIEQNKSLNRNEFFKEITIHQTEITNYKKQMGTCVITLQSAVGHIHYIMEDGKLIEGSEEYTEQTKCNIDLVYIQDISKINFAETTAVGTTCPNCGAPITNLGAKVCEYCNMAVEEINIRVWSINKYTNLKK